MTCEAPAGIDGKDGPSYVDSVTAASSSGRRRHGDRRGEGRKKTRAFVPVPETSAGSVAFEAYYKAQGIVPDAEWSDFMGFMRKPLPVVVRVNARRAGWEELKAAFAADPRFQQLAWYPGGLAFQCASASLDGPLRECLGQLNRSYALRMQEAASLLPALLMRPGPEDLVLDMAAAPGGKSLQILELMAAAGDGGHGLGGAIIANDGDAERAMELLPLMLRKAHHPGIAVTLGSAAKFPAVFAPPGANEASTSQSADRQVLLDRVLCDVPCSSDGTLRKAPGIMARWRPHQGSLLHKKQLTILRRGLHLLKKGGRLVYSTCSLNPIECEAVVAAALAAFRGDCELVEDEAVEELRRAGLRARAGLASWKVPDTQRPKRQKAPDDQPPASEVGSAGVGCTLYTSLEEVPKEALSGLCATMFPPSNPEVLSQLRKAVRLLPQDNDSSGFFVAVFTKTRHWDAQPLSNSTPLPVEAVAVPALAPEKATVQADQMPLGAVATLRWRARNDLNVYELLDAAIDPEAQSIASYYGVDLKTLPGKLVAERNVHGNVRQLLLVAPRLLDYLQADLGQLRSPILLACGVPVFKRMDDGYMCEIGLECRWRPALEAASLLGVRCARRTLRLGKAAFEKLLRDRKLPLEEIVELAASGELEGLQSCHDKVGGVLVGLKSYDFWLPGVITAKALEAYASTIEVGEAPGAWLDSALPPPSHDKADAGASPDEPAELE